METVSEKPEPIALPSWFEEQENLVSLAHWMEANDMFDTVNQAIDFFEKPWNYHSEWEEYQNG
jgi:hypothetical protein